MSVVELSLTRDMLITIFLSKASSTTTTNAYYKSFETGTCLSFIIINPSESNLDKRYIRATKETDELNNPIKKKFENRSCDRFREGHKSKARASWECGSGLSEFEALDVQLDLTFQDASRKHQRSEDLGQVDVAVVIGGVVVEDVVVVVGMFSLQPEELRRLVLEQNFSWVFDNQKSKHCSQSKSFANLLNDSGRTNYPRALDFSILRSSDKRSF